MATDVTATSLPPHRLDAAAGDAAAARSQRTWWRMARTLLVTQIVLCLATIPLYPAYGLHIVWFTAVPQVVFTAVLLALAWHTRRDRRSAAPGLVGTALLLSGAAIIGPAQYLAARMGWPLADPWLAATDRWLGVSVPTIARWTAQHAWLARVLGLAYMSFLPQFIVPLVVHGLFRRDWSAMGEYLFHFHACALITLAGLVIWPAACPFGYLGSISLLDQTRFLTQFAALRAGTFHAIDYRNLEGLISFPSFHAAGALFITWSLRRTRALLIPIAALNVLLIASTILLGVHYAIDVIAAVPVFAASLAAYRLWRSAGE